MTPYNCVVLKAFGDLVIAATELERAPAGMDVSLTVGRHLEPLARALKLSVPCRSLAKSEPNVPAMYDVKRRGPIAALVSLARTRRALHAEPLNGPLLFDRIGPRERFLSLPHQMASLPDRNNIYLAYRALTGAGDATLPSQQFGDQPTIGIFPGSRVEAKNLSAGLVDDIAAHCSARGWRTETLLLDGERDDLQRAERAHRIIPRDFAAMIAAVEFCDGIVSADSLPAHLAERAGKPVFVFSPVTNDYWLPHSSYIAGYHALFGAGAQSSAFDRFLTALSGQSPQAQ
jgi:hypothetical protein